MPTFAPPPPLEAAWQSVTEGALGRSVAPRSLAVMVERLSAQYRGEAVALAPADALAARALFWLPRDLPKVHRAVVELAHADALPRRPLRVLDLGAGLGATSLGLLRALPPGHRVAEVTAVDLDPRALELCAALVRGAQSAGLVDRAVRFETLTRDLAAPGWDEGLGTYDLVLAGLSLVEVARDAGASDEARGAVIAARVQSILPHVSAEGALILLEPGNRREARALHHARARCLDAGATVFAPCLHADACGMLATERDWCHEDLADFTLPAWLVPIAKLAGLRWEGLTWSYLVLRRDGRTLEAAVGAPGRRALRVVSMPRVTKGKTECFVCGAGAPTLRRVMELERDAKKSEHPVLQSLARGDLVVTEAARVEGEAAATLRLAPGTWEPVAR